MSLIKTVLLTLCLILILPILIFAQTPGSLDAPPKPKPVEPVIPSQHAGPGRIGVRLAFAKNTGLPEIVGLIQGGPASDFGFRIGDVILKIDRNYTNSLSEDEVRLALHGEPGTGVELTVQRGDNPDLIVRAVERCVLPAHAEENLEAAVIESTP